MNPSPGYFLAVLVLLTANAAGQMLSAQPAEAYGNAATSYQPINCGERLHWIVDSTIGPESLAAGLFTAGFGTARNSPREDGPHWDGFRDRYGMRLTGIATGNAMEAALGLLWGEDPRYFSATGRPFKGRIKNVVVITFEAGLTGTWLPPTPDTWATPAITSFQIPGEPTANPVPEMLACA
ncbi:MAG: hypothetical protein ACXVZH_13650 [Terriglobales bacterium]